MTRSCIVCDNRYEQDYQLMFHKFPKDLKLKQVWCQVLNLSIDSITRGTFLCSEHFSTSDYFVGSRRLVKGATPKSVACFKTDNSIIIKKDEEIVNEEIIEIKNEPLWVDCPNILNAERSQNEISSNIDNFWVNPNLLINTSNIKQEFKYDPDEFKGNVINNEIDLPTIKEEVIGNNGSNQLFKTIAHISRKNKFFCPVCRKYYASCKSRNHFTKHFKEKIVLCYCGKYFTEAFHYSRHYFVHFVKNCNISLKSYTKEFGVHVGEEFELFNDESNDEEPTLNRRGIRKGEKPYKCQICSSQFVNEHTLSRHYKIHSGEKPHKCEICLKRFTQKQQLTIHFRIHTGEKPYKCQICMKQFTNKTGLTEHIGVHGGEKPYQCKICLKRLSTKTRLASHAKMHGEKIHKCETCLKLFSNKSNLKSHTRTHTGERPYKCEICLKRFSKKSTLTCHSRTHTGEKPFRCETCSKHFRTKSHLTKHSKLHAGEKPCSILFDCLKQL